MKSLIKITTVTESVTSNSMFMLQSCESTPQHKQKLTGERGRGGGGGMTEQFREITEIFAHEVRKTFATTIFLKILVQPFWGSSEGSGKSPNRSMVAETATKGQFLHSLPPPMCSWVCARTDDVHGNRPLKRDNSSISGEEE